MLRKTLSLLLSFTFIFQQIGFAQLAAELNIASHLSQLHSVLAPDKFRPLHMRYFSYDNLSNEFKIFIDKGDEQQGLSPTTNGSPEGIRGKGTVPEVRVKELLKYFLIGITLPDEAFWVNLRPDSPDNIIDEELAKTDVGKIMLETDLQLKKDTALATSPQTTEGKVYWDRLYKKAEELYGTENVTIPTLTRPWIVPDEIIVRENKDSAYVYKATLKVLLEQDYLKSAGSLVQGVSDYTFKDERAKELNEYSTQLIRELIIPKLTKEVNTAKRYSSFRQVYFSLILSRWFKARFRDSSQGRVARGEGASFIKKIDTQDLSGLNSKENWDTLNYFQAYKKSFAEGEYNIKEPAYTPTGQVIRSYFSGGIQAGSPLNQAMAGVSSAIGAGLSQEETILRAGMLGYVGDSFNRLNPLSLPRSAGSAIKASSALKIVPENAAIELDYLMRLLTVKDYPRVTQMLKTSLDVEAFVDNLAAKGKIGIEPLLSMLDTNAYFRPIAAYYRLKKAGKINANEVGNKKMHVNTDDYKVIIDHPDVAIGNPHSEYLLAMRDDAAVAPNAFRDNMDAYVGRFLAEDRYTGQKDSPDLKDTIDQIKEFLRGLNLDEIKYIITSGIGANEMYSHQLAAAFNEYFEHIGKDVKWIVVNNPEHLIKIPADADSKNSIVFEMSRSGGTKETVNFLEASTGERFNLTNRIVAANSGKLNELALGLQAKEGSNVLIIQDIRGDIGGRQMNRKTLMTFAPLFVALAAGLKDVDNAEEYLRDYVHALFNANEDLSYSLGGDSAAVRVAEHLFKHREDGRNKFSIIYDRGFRGMAKEFVQPINEGANENVMAGYTNDNVIDIYSLADDRAAYQAAFDKAAGSQLPIFLLNQNSPDYKKNLRYIDSLRDKGIPAISIASRVFSDELTLQLMILAKATALLQDTAAYFAIIAREDYNSNPQVKLVREITAIMPRIILRKIKEAEQAGKPVDYRISMQEVLAEVENKRNEDAANAVTTIDKRSVVKEEHVTEFESLVKAIKGLSALSNIAADDVAGIFIQSVSKDLFKISLGEAGGQGTAVIDEAFNRSGLKELGALTKSRQINPLEDQVFLKAEDTERVSVAHNAKHGFNLDSKETIAQQLADYMLFMYQTRHSKYFALTFMESDSDNPIIKELREYINTTFGDLDITCLLQPIPNIAHTGIEGPFSHPDKIINLTIAYTHTYGERHGNLGNQLVGDLTLDQTLYMYIMSNVYRMPWGGTPSAYFEMRNKDNLPKIAETIKEALGIFRGKINAVSSAATAASSSALRTVTTSDDSVFEIPESFLGVKFGTSGQRGKHGEQLNSGIAAAITEGIVGFANQHSSFTGKKKVVIIGSDPRSFNAQYQEEEARVALDNGFKVFAFEEPMPTPIGSFVVRYADKIFKLDQDEVVVGTINNTPSHNPKQDGGIKLNPGAELQGAPSEPDVNNVIQNIANGIIGKGSGINRLSDSIDFLTHANYSSVDVQKVFDVYIERVSKLIDFDKIRRAIREKGLTWNVSTMHGAAGWWMRKAFEAIDNDFFTLFHEEPLPDFGDLPLGPNTEKLEKQKEYFEEFFSKPSDGKGATDGDGDRFYLADENGNKVNFNVALALVFDYMLNRKGIGGAFITCVDGTSMFEKIGKVLKRTRIGFKEFQYALKDPSENVILAGEGGSGGLTLGGHILDKDGIIAQLIFVEMAADAKLRGLKISDLINELYKKYGYYVMPDTRSIPINSDERTAIAVKIMVPQMLAERYKVKDEMFPGYTIDSIDSTDGLKFFLKEKATGAIQSILIRPSGTGREMRDYNEAVSLVSYEDGWNIANAMAQEEDELVAQLINEAITKITAESPAAVSSALEEFTTSFTSLVVDEEYASMTLLQIEEVIQGRLEKNRYKDSTKMAQYLTKIIRELRETISSPQFFADKRKYVHDKLYQILLNLNTQVTSSVRLPHDTSFWLEVRDVLIAPEADSVIRGWYLEWYNTARSLYAYAVDNGQNKPEALLFALNRVADTRAPMGLRFVLEGDMIKLFSSQAPVAVGSAIDTNQLVDTIVGIIMGEESAYNSNQMVKAALSRAGFNQQEVEQLAKIAADLRDHARASTFQGDDPEAYIRDGLSKVINSRVSSSAMESLEVIPNPKVVGGIDVTKMDIKYQPMGNFNGLNVELPNLSYADLEKMQLDVEARAIEEMLENEKAPIPCGERIKEFLAACKQKHQLDTYRDDMRVWLMKIGMKEEDLCCSSSDDYKEAIVLVENIVS